MSPTVKKYIIPEICPVRMLMNNPDIKLRKYNKAINILFERTTYDPHLTLNRERLEFNYKTDNEGYTEYYFNRTYQQSNYIISESVVVKDYTFGKPEFLIRIVFQHSRSTNSYTYYLTDNGIMDSRGFFYQKVSCLNRYHLNILIE